MNITVSKCFASAILMLIAVPAFAGESSWITNYTKAVEQAQSQNKAILLDFTGSDWCGWCIKMKKETLETPMFKHYAENNLVLVEVDFPQNKPQTDAVKTQNQHLSQQFQISGYPTFVLLDKGGKELGRQIGYLEGGPSAFINKLNTFYTPAPSSSGTNAPDDFGAFFKKPAQTAAP